MAAISSRSAIFDLHIASECQRGLRALVASEASRQNSDGNRDPGGERDRAGEEADIAAQSELTA
jgi:hypothetical protein